MTTNATQATGEAVPALATGIHAKINGTSHQCGIHRSDLRYFENLFGPAFRLRVSEQSNGSSYRRKPL